jgi:hypothetical protein
VEHPATFTGSGGPWDGSGFAAHAIDLVALHGRGIQELTIFRTPEALARFGLQPRLDG